MLERLAVWVGPIAIGLYLPVLIQTVSEWIYKVLASHLDHAIPDDLPQTAGEWLDQQLAESAPALQVRALVSESSGVDFYHYAGQVIHLSARTHFKADPIFWATAAHELGHARFRTRHPALGALDNLKRVNAVCGRLGFALVFGNVLFGVPGVTDLGFQLLSAAMLLSGVTLVEEVVASAWGLRLLRRAPALLPPHLRAARWILGAALGTYLARLVGRVLLVSQWGRVLELTGDGLFAGVAAPLAGWRTAVVVIASVIGALLALDRIRTVLTAAEETLVGGLARLLWYAAFPMLLALVWDSRGDATWVWCVFLAVVAGVTEVILVLTLPAAVIPLALGWIAPRLWMRRGEFHRSEAFVEAHARGKRRMARDTPRLNDLLLGSRGSGGVSAWRMLVLVVDLGYLPLLCLIWLS